MVDPSPEPRQLLARLDPCPEMPERTARRKLADPAKGQIERRSGDRGEHLADLLKARHVDIADEPQRQMQAVIRRPPGIRQPLTQTGDAGPDPVGQLQGDKKTWHERLPE